MATAADTKSGDRISDSSAPNNTLTKFVDRWIYVFMAGLLTIITLAGFIPDSFARLAAIEAGQRPPFLPLIHVHAVLMGSWMLLLLAQTIQMATGRKANHRRLGKVAMVLAPAIVLIGVTMAIARFQQVWDWVYAAPGGATAAGLIAISRGSNIVLLQLLFVLLFPILVWIGLRARSRDAGMHKRMMILAITPAMTAAIDRILWLPNSFPVTPVWSFCYLLLIISPMIVWDLYRLKTVHRAYLVWLGISLPGVIAVTALWSSPWWLALVPRLMGVS